MMKAPHCHRAGLSRRHFLVGMGATGLTVAVTAALPAMAAAITDQPGEGLQPNVWVTIGQDGFVTIISPSAEMGQGVMTASPLLVAEDMDADWGRVRVLQAPADMAYGNAEFGGVQLTGGSTTIPVYYTALRMAGAQSRLIMIAMAAGLMGVSAQELTTEPHRVIHDASGQSLDYGEIVASGVLPDPLPEAIEADLKPASAFRYIGRSQPRIDVPSKVNGSAVYGVDVTAPDMLYGIVVRPPVQGETPVIIEATRAASVKGVHHIVELPYGVGIIGETFEALRRAREQLAITWTEAAPARAYSSEKMIETYRTAARDRSIAAGVVADSGDTDLVMAAALTVIEADYLVDHVHHATMEPMTAAARFDGERLHIWAPTQAQSLTVWAAAELLGIDPEKVTLTTTLAGGGLGRKAEVDFISDAVLLARQADRPVKVIWTREDDVRHGKYRPLVAHHGRIGLDSSGKLAVWQQRLVADSIYARWYPDAFTEANGLDDTVYGGLESNYNLPAQRNEYLRMDSGIDIGFSRGTAEGYTKFGVECLLDEAAAAAGRDPLQFRLDHLAHDARAQAVLVAIGEMSKWDQPRGDDKALGLAYSRAYGTYCAEVVEISLDRESGQISVHQVWCVVDPGLAVQPDNIEAQISGAVIQGVGNALYEQINIIDGQVQEANFDTYRVLRMSEIPEIHVRIMSTDHAPGGIGEVGIPPVAPAIANAVARLTGARLRHMPFLAERVLTALRA